MCNYDQAEIESYMSSGYTYGEAIRAIDRANQRADDRAEERALERLNPTDQEDSEDYPES